MLSTIKYKLSKNFLYVLAKFLPPRALSKTTTVGVSTIIGHEHVMMLTVSLNSFFYYSNLTLPCLVVNDGSLTPGDKQFLKTKFKNIEIIDPDEAERRVNQQIAEYPKLYAYRNDTKSSFTKIKLLDTVLLSRYNKIILMDCDILYFKKPTKMIRWINSPEDKFLYSSNLSHVENRNFDSLQHAWKIINQMFIHEINKHINPEFNSGLICIPRTFYSLKRLEQLINYCFATGLNETWSPEQFLFSALTFDNPREYLGQKYVHIFRSFDFQRLPNPKDYIFIHFAHLTKRFFYPLAIKQLLSTAFFTKQGA